MRKECHMVDAGQCATEAASAGSILNVFFIYSKVRTMEIDAPVAVSAQKANKYCKCCKCGNFGAGSFKIAGIQMKRQKRSNSGHGEKNFAGFRTKCHFYIALCKTLQAVIGVTTSAQYAKVTWILNTFSNLLIKWAANKS
ncbi:hypothetical protein NPIL_381061 [Nephila pilipes]|uniref:Uncharacterized protein n=1 Tax=Nephila pilipes TaxID=299642 RepID=A0A8X6MAQ4_NEPPI|nr:hypothetical protein NPIL_381061 [Nephila pilipes]